MNHIFGIFRFKDSIAGHHRIGAGVDDVRDIVRIHAAIDFDERVRLVAFYHRPQFGDAVQRTWDELLSAETGVYGHNQH